MDERKQGIWYMAGACFLAIVYIIIVKLLKPEMDTASTIIAGFTLFSFFPLCLHFLARIKTVPDFIFNAAFSTISLIYFGIQLVVGGIVLFSFNDLPWVPVLVFELVLLCIYVVMGFAVFEIQNRANNKAAEERQTVIQKQKWEATVQGMMDNLEETDDKETFSQLLEAVHYSDAVSYPGMESIDTEINSGLSELGNLIFAKDPSAPEKAKSLIKLLKNRERLADTLKRE